MRPTRIVGARDALALCATLVLCAAWPALANAARPDSQSEADVQGGYPPSVRYGPERPFYEPRLGVLNRHYVHPSFAVLRETTRRVDPGATQGAGAQAAESAAPSVPAVDLGRLALAQADWRRAATVYARRAGERVEREALHPDMPRDRTAACLLALALLGDRRPAEAEPVLLRAFEDDPDLLARGIQWDAMLGKGGDLRTLVGVAVRYATASDTPDAWTLVARLMALQGREAQSGAMLERARQRRDGTGAAPGGGKKQVRTPTSRGTGERPGIPAPR